MAPTRDGFINAIQVWPYTEGALYQVYASPGRVTLIQLQPGERLIDVSAGDTVRWILGDSISGSGAIQRSNLQVKPVRAGLKTNLVVTTDRRIYLLELTSTESAWMASVSWDYPQDRLDALNAQAQAAQQVTLLAAGLSVDQLQSAMTSRATSRLGGRCGPLMMGARSISSSRPASHRASCRRYSWWGRKAMCNW